MRTLEQCDERLRAVVQAQDFAGSQLAVSEYRQAFDARWGALSADERRKSELPERAAVLMGWALCMITLFRTALYARSRAAKAGARYVRNGHVSAGHTWGMAG